MKPRYQLDENGMPQLLPEEKSPEALVVTRAMLFEMKRSLYGVPYLDHIVGELHKLFPELIPSSLSNDQIRSALERARYHFVDAGTASFDGYFMERVLCMAIVDVAAPPTTLISFPHFEGFLIPRWHRPISEE